MIHNHLQTSEIYLHVFKKADENEVRISSGTILTPSDFRADKTVLVSFEKPNLLWDLLYDMMGIRSPDKLMKSISAPKVVQENSEPPSEIEKLFLSMSGREIIQKVKTEKGIDITISPKSKAAIIKKAVKIYSN